MFHTKVTTCPFVCFLCSFLCGKEGVHTITSHIFNFIVTLTLSPSSDHKAILIGECKLLFIFLWLSGAFKQLLLTILKELYCNLWLTKSGNFKIFELWTWCLSLLWSVCTLDSRCHSCALWRATSTSRCSVMLAQRWRRGASWWVQSDQIITTDQLTLRWALMCWYRYVVMLCPSPDDVWRC